MTVINRLPKYMHHVYAEISEEIPQQAVAKVGQTLVKMLAELRELQALDDLFYNSTISQELKSLDPVERARHHYNNAYNAFVQENGEEQAMGTYYNAMLCHERNQKLELDVVSFVQQSLSRSDFEKWKESWEAAKSS